MNQTTKHGLLAKSKKLRKQSNTYLFVHSNLKENRNTRKTQTSENAYPLLITGFFDTLSVLFNLFFIVKQHKNQKLQKCTLHCIYIYIYTIYWRKEKKLIQVWAKA